MLAFVALICFLLGTVQMQNVGALGQCVMYGHCGPNPDNPHFQLNCVYDGSPKKVDPESYPSLQRYCPELVAEFGDELCCATQQIEDLAQSLVLPEAVLARCPSCYHNFRQIFCDIACSPRQSEFLNATKIVLNIEGIPMVKVLEAFVQESYINETYNSCKDVMLEFTGGPAMDLLCGQWGAANCTATKWFDYMGTTENGFAPFDIIYKYVKHGEAIKPPIVPFNSTTFKCSESIGNGAPRCSCLDCKDSCSAPTKIFDILGMKKLE